MLHVVCFTEMSNNNRIVISTDNNANTYELQVISGGGDVTHTRFAIANGLFSTKKLKKKKSLGHRLILARILSFPCSFVAKSL